MRSTWKPTKLSDVLVPVSRVEKVDAIKEYRLLGIRLDGKGPFHRETKLGSQISSTSLSRVNAGDFIYSRLFAWRGAFGVISHDLDGCYVSGEFPTFASKPGKIDLEFLRLWFRLPTTITMVEADCSGSTPLTRNRFKEQFFLSMVIPLPPLSEQQRIVARIEELAAKIEDAIALRQKSIKESVFLRQRSIDALLQIMPAKRFKLGDLLSEPMLNGLSLSASSMGSGVTFAKVGVVNTGMFNPLETKQANVDLSDNSPYWLNKGDIVVSRGNAIELVGRAAVYTGLPPNCAIPDLLIRIRVNRERIDPFFLVSFFHSSEAREYIESKAIGTSSTMPKISQPKLRALPIPVPTLTEQRQIEKCLGEIQTKVETLKALQNETAVELEALLPSVLDRAFKGEL